MKQKISERKDKENIEYRLRSVICTNVDIDQAVRRHSIRVSVLAGYRGELRVDLSQHRAQSGLLTLQSSLGFSFPPHPSSSPLSGNSPSISILVLNLNPGLVDPHPLHSNQLPLTPLPYIVT